MRKARAVPARVQATRSLAAAALLAALAMPLAAQPAQPAAPVDTLRSDTLPAARLAPVVVEVFRTPLEAGRVPFASSVVDEDRIRRARPGLALDEALRGVPGVQVDNRHIYALGERISVRGFGARAQFGVRGVRVVVDGIPATFADGQSALEIIDPGLLGRAEVIRGPASALYGNAAGGVIVFRSPAVATVPLYQQYRVSGGEHGMLRLEAQARGRSGGFDYRVGLSHFDWDGFREHSSASHLRGTGSVGVPLAAGTLRLSGAFVEFDARNPGALPLQRFREEPSAAAPMNVTRAAGKEGRQRQLGLGWSGPLGAGELEVTAYGIRRWIRNPIVPFFIDLDRDAGGFRGVYRGDWWGRATGVIGFDLDLQRDDRRNFVNADGEPGALVRDQREWVRSAAPFAHLAVAPMPGIDLMAGLRYDHFRFQVDDRFHPGGVDESGARVMAALSPSVGAVVNLGAGVAAFANLATAFETPTTTELANRPDEAGGFNPDLEPQRTVSGELGVRGSLGAASYELSAYHAAVRNSLIPFEVLDVPGRTYFRNAGAARHRGVEAAARARPVPWLEASVAYTHTDARFTDYEVAGARLDGNRVPGVAPHRTELGLSWELATGPFLGLDLRYNAATPADDANTEHAPAYATVDLRTGHGGLRAGRSEFRPFLSLTNLFDRRYAASVVPNASAAAGQPRPFYEPAPGRSLYVGLEVGIGGAD